VSNKIRLLSVLLLLNLAPSAALADDSSAVGFWNVLPETILRPTGFLSLVGGCVMFVAAAPFTSVASLEAPHDAWSNSFNGFIGAPIRYTFDRPLGDYSFKVHPD
jgi:hypothetical protein